jgi:hypothetical protein
MTAESAVGAPTCCFRPDSKAVAEILGRHIWLSPLPPDFIESCMVGKVQWHTAWHGMAWHSAMWRDTTWHDTTQHDRHVMAVRGVTRCEHYTRRHDMTWHAWNDMRSMIWPIQNWHLMTAEGTIGVPTWYNGFYIDVFIHFLSGYNVNYGLRTAVSFSHPVAARQVFENLCGTHRYKTQLIRYNSILSYFAFFLPNGYLL